MTKPLTETQRAILRNAAAHRNGPAAPPASLPPAPRIAVGKALLGAGLLARVGGSEGMDPGLGWKLDGDSVLLRITAAGLQAIGAAPAAAAPEPPACSVAAPAGHAAAAAQGAALAIPRPTGREARRGAAQAVVAAWDAVARGQRWRRPRLVVWRPAAVGIARSSP